MEAYSDFAEVYDNFMEDTPYPLWCQRITECIQKYGISKPAAAGAASRDALESERNLVLDLGCGTGTMSILLAKMGYDVIGVDNSSAMLNVAIEKSKREGLDILFLMQDMRMLELYSTAGTIISVCDSLNYLLTEEDVLSVFSLVNNYLYPGGLFLFDFNTVYKYSEIIGDTTIAENREGCSFIWENYYNPEEEMNEYDLTLFIEIEEELYHKVEETHYQRGYTLETMRMLAERAGLQWISAIDADTGNEVTDSTQRVFVIAKEFGKEV